MVAVVGKKVGMSRIYQENGTVVPVTLIQVYESLISDVKNNEDKDFNQITMSFGKDKKTEKRLNKSVLGFYKKNNLEAYDDMQTFKVGKDEEFKIGDFIGLAQLAVGNIINATGISKGKGFAGVVKRFGFKGECATHGVSLTHRHQGGTGNRRREGKVRKGLSMPGQMGNEQVTVKNLEVVKIIPEDNIVCVKGAIPGAKGGKIIINTSK